jgi:hemolysin activation/secretion protein
MDVLMQYINRIKYLITIFLFCSACYGQEIKGIVLLGNKQQLLSQDEAAGKEIFIEKSKVPLREKLAGKLKNFLGMDVTKDNLMLIRRTISMHYELAGMPFVVVQIPPQEVTDGVVQFSVVEAKVDCIDIKGTNWTNKGMLLGYLSVDPGDYVDEDSLAYDLAFMNRNPFRTASLIYSPGRELETTNVTIYSDDRVPFQAYVGAQNNGVETTGRNRYFVGFMWGRVMGWDQVLSYQYTASGDFDKFQGHTGQYLIMLPWKHVFNIFGGYAKVHPGLSYPVEDSNGKSYQLSARYVVPLPQDPNLEHEIYFGGDFKRTNNNVQFTANLVNAFGTNVNLLQFLLGYKGKYHPGNNVFDYDVQIVGSPGRWLPDQTNADFNSLRPGADNKWVYNRFYLSYLQALPANFLIYLSSRGQITPSALLPSEQLGIGGYDTVRGFEQRAFNADNGIIMNFEFRLPYFGFLYKERDDDRIRDKMQFFGFADFGWGSNVKDIEGQKNNAALLGVGPGFRFTVGTHVSIRVDYGFRLVTNSFVGGQGGRLHFSALLSY